MKYPEVDRRTDLSIREFNREYRDRGRPVVITDEYVGRDNIVKRIQRKLAG